ncbi:heme ABC transporter ATP-binding protein [Candidatus Bipolaricaulota bacterium]|nr:heme ABC transporter ATP-binding protein [Candidatus Bipolaricaulota bacterium]
MNITIEGLHFSYGQNPVLEKIDLSIQKGEIFAIVGPNGSGKTTLLKNISGVLTPDRGAVYLNMRQIADLSTWEIARQLTMVEQDREVSFDFTVREVIAIGRIPHQSRFARENKVDKELIEEAMRVCSVDLMTNRLIAEISGGERQRVFLAMALAQEPKVLLLDEPTTHLDINYQAQIMEIIRAQAIDGLTVVMALHDLNLVAQYADRAAMLDKGQLLEIGKPDEVLTEANIKRVFHADVIVTNHPLTNSFYVMPLAHRFHGGKSRSSEHELL